MPTSNERYAWWTEQARRRSGPGWAHDDGSAHLAWAAIIYPRLEPFLPAEHILELGPGLGRWTAHLRRHTRCLTLVDPEPRCIRACRRRFGRRGVRYHTGDARSLAMIVDHSVDLVFGWRSLLRADRASLHACIAELASKLRPGGVALIQHSHVGSYLNPATGQPRIPNRHGFGSDVSAATVAEDCRAAHLHLLEQEIVPWASDELISCFSLIRRPVAGDLHPGSCEPFINYEWARSRESVRRQDPRTPDSDFVIR